MNEAPTRSPARSAWTLRQLNALFTLYVWLVWCVVLLALGPLAALAVLISRPLGFRVVKAFCRFALGLAGIRVRVRGHEQVDWARAHVYMGNHQNMLDPFALVIAVQGFMVGIEKRENLAIPVYGWLSRVWGNLPIARDNPAAARDTIAQAVRLLRAGTSIAILPEGTRSKDGTIGPFKKGGFHLALDAGADIVPFTINGAYARLQTGSWRVYPGTIEIVFGPAIATNRFDKASIDGLVGTVRAAIVANYSG